MCGTLPPPGVEKRLESLGGFVVLVLVLVVVDRSFGVVVVTSGKDGAMHDVELERTTRYDIDADEAHLQSTGVPDVFGDMVHVAGRAVLDCGTTMGAEAAERGRAAFAASVAVAAASPITGCVGGVHDIVVLRVGGRLGSASQGGGTREVGGLQSGWAGTPRLWQGGDNDLQHQSKWRRSIPHSKRV